MYNPDMFRDLKEDLQITVKTDDAKSYALFYSIFVILA